MVRIHRVAPALQALYLLPLVLLLLPSKAAAQPPPTYTRWILAEGAANAFFDEDIVIGNPNGAPATITITLLPQGEPKIDVPPFTIPASSRHTFSVRPHLSDLGASVSAVVESTQPVVVERTMTWAFGQRRGGHNSPGLLDTAPTWYMAEGVVGFFETFILITNPDPTHDAAVDVTLLREHSGPLTKSIVVPANGRETIYVNPGIDFDNDGVPELLQEPFSTVVHSTNGVNVAVERAMYWNNFEGGHESTAVTAPDTTWLFAEGVTGGDAAFSWDTYLLLANPGAAPADVTLTFFRDGAPPLTYTTTVDAAKRKTLQVRYIDVDNDGVPDLPSATFATRIVSSVPIVAERAQYWSSNGITYIEGHNTPGLNAEAEKWAFAEGVEGIIDSTGIGYVSYFLVSNSSASPLELRATFVREDGQGIVRTFTIAPQSRFTLPTNTYPELNHHRFSAFLESTNGVPFASERAVYWGEGFYGGHASVGTPWTGAIAQPPIVQLMPVISEISPSRGLTTGGTDVTITGMNFVESLGAVQGTQVLFGDKPAAGIRVLNSTMLIARAPGATGPGAVPVTVSNASLNPAWATTRPNGYTYDPVEPILLTDLTLAFGDSITYGVTSEWCDLGNGIEIVCTSKGPALGYPQRTQGLLRSRYPNQGGIEVHRSGIPGECASQPCVSTSSGRQRLSELLGGQHDLVVLLEGVNDLNGGFSIGSIIDSLRGMIQAAKAQGKKVILSSLTPVKAKEDAPGDAPDFWKANPDRIVQLNAAIDLLAGEQQVPRVNMFAAFGSGSGALSCNQTASCRNLLSPDGLHPNDAGYQRMAEAVAAKIAEAFEVR